MTQKYSITINSRSKHCIAHWFISYALSTHSPIWNIAYSYLYLPYSTKSIPLVNYCGTFSPNLGLTKIFVIPTYESLHQMQLELKTNDISVHYNLGVGTNGHLKLLLTNYQYSLITNTAYVRPVHPIFIHIPNNVTRVAINVFTHSFNKPLCFFIKLEELNNLWFNRLLLLLNNNT